MFFSLSSCTVSRIRSNQQPSRVPPSFTLLLCRAGNSSNSAGKRDLLHGSDDGSKLFRHGRVGFFCFASLRPIHLPIITRFEFGTICGGCNAVCCWASMKWGRHRRRSSVKHPLVILNYWPSFLTVVVHVSSLQEDLQWLSKMLVPSNPSLNNCKVRAS